MALLRLIKIIVLCSLVAVLIYLRKDIEVLKKNITWRNLFYYNHSNVYVTRFNSEKFKGNVYNKPYSFVDFTNEYNLLLNYLAAGSDYDSTEYLNTVNDLDEQKKIVSFSDNEREDSISPKNLNNKDFNLISLKNLLAVCVHAARLGGITVKEIHKHFEIKELKKKSGHDISSNLSIFGTLQSHIAMLYTLRKIFPDIKIISKWRSDVPLRFNSRKFPDFPQVDVDKSLEDVLVPAKDVLVWMNPLDGFKEYTKSYLDYVTTMVCVAINGKPVIGVIHEPFQNITVWGWKNKAVSNSTLDYSNGFSHSRPLTVVVSHSQTEALAVKHNFGSDAMVIVAGGAGFKSLQVARGVADAYLHVSPIKKWDICAGNAILNSLNGTMTALDGEEIDYGDQEKIVNKRGVLASMNKNEEHELYFDLIHSILQPF